MADRRTSFAADYRQHVLPLLEAPSYIAAARLALDYGQFRDALADVWSEACRLGAGFLPPAAFDELREWIMCRLLRDCDVIQSATEALEAQAWLDPVRYYDGLSDDPALRWTFAAISEPYRRALIERTRQRKVTAWRG